MDIRKFFPVEVKKKENQEPKKLKNTATTDGYVPRLNNNIVSESQKKMDVKKMDIKKVVIHELWTDGSTFNNGKKNKKQYGELEYFLKRMILEIYVKFYRDLKLQIM